MPVPQNLKLVNAGRIDQEFALNPNAPGSNAPHCNRAIDPASFQANDSSLENLDALISTFNNAHMNLDRITDCQFRQRVINRFD
jgi:hypothetical protein